MFPYSLVCEIKKKKKHLLSLPQGTPVRIKDNVECAGAYHKGGELIFQNYPNSDDKEFEFGIMIRGGVCYQFKWFDYELL